MNVTRTRTKREMKSVQVAPAKKDCSEQKESLSLGVTDFAGFKISFFGTEAI